ncbi:MAG: Bacterial Ig-like domain (group 1) [Syntrophaceae bacterium PtaB.Bin095]|nr:MAG: Bacterial Ig-like domain (group 1) [Syntrophaceae bacterium PtaB.Bin095]
MRKHMRMFVLLIAALALSACGGGETSGDPLGTDSITVKAEPETVGPGQESVITATVARFNENPAIERSVTFTFRTNNSGGTLRAVNNRVDGQNQARAVYTAGWNAPGAEISDTIQASLPNGAGAVVVITRAGSGIAEMKAEPSEVAANQSSVVTVSVTDSGDKPISGAMVFFSIPVANSGSPSLTAYSAVTDGLGKATTVYTPGSASPDQTVSDTVEARLANGSSRSVVITRTGVAEEPVETAEPLAISVAANPASVSAGGLSIITAKVRTSNTEAAVSGVAVTFSVNGAGGAETVSPATAVTDRNGNATTVFIGNSGAAAGSANAVKASMTAGGNTYTAAVVIPYP